MLHDKVPLGVQTNSKELEGHFRGITASDLAIAIADEAEMAAGREAEMAWAELREEILVSPFVRLGEVGTARFMEVK